MVHSSAEGHGGSVYSDFPQRKSAPNRYCKISIIKIIFVHFLATGNISNIQQYCNIIEIDKRKDMFRS